MKLNKNMLNSGIRPSAMASIIKCPGKVNLVDELKLKDITSFAAAEGSLAHRMAEHMLRDGCYVIDGCYENTLYPFGSSHEIDGIRVTVNQDMLDGVKNYSDHIEQLRTDHEGPSRKDDIEHAISWELNESNFLSGTIDYYMHFSSDILYIRDFKYGKGIAVEAIENIQLMTYAVLLLSEERMQDIEMINLGIVQPRSPDGDTLKTWWISVDDLNGWKDEILTKAVLLANTQKAPLIPGEDQCRWCLAKGFCPAILDLAISSFTKESVTVDGYLSIEELQEIYPVIPVMEGWIKAVKKRVSRHLVSGQAFKGYKAVKGRSFRKWKDIDSAQGFLTEHDILPFEKKMLSPAKAEKLLSKDQRKELKEYYEYGDSRPVVVAKKDKRRDLFEFDSSFGGYALLESHIK